MPTFAPPLVYDVPTILPDVRDGAWRVRRYAKPNARGVNVYVMPDGTVTQSDPAHTSAEVAADVPLAPTITYYGGHVYLISAADAAVLTSAGYGSNIT